MSHVSASPPAPATFQGCIRQLSSEAQVSCGLSMFALSRAMYGNDHPRVFPEENPMSPLTCWREGLPNRCHYTARPPRIPRSPGLHQCSHNVRPRRNKQHQPGPLGLWDDHSVPLTDSQAPYFPMYPAVCLAQKYLKFLSPNSSGASCLAQNLKLKSFQLWIKKDHRDPNETRVAGTLWGSPSSCPFLTVLLSACYW